MVIEVNFGIQSNIWITIQVCIVSRGLRICNSL